MLSDYSVKVVYKNKALEPVSERTYSLVDYCQEMKLGIMRTIMDVENAYYSLQGKKEKQEWDSETMKSFQHIRHKLLDAANNIQRIPNNLYVGNQNVNTIKLSEYIVDVADRIKE